MATAGSFHWRLLGYALYGTSLEIRFGQTPSQKRLRCCGVIALIDEQAFKDFQHTHTSCSRPSWVSANMDSNRRVLFAATRSPCRIRSASDLQRI